MQSPLINQQISMDQIGLNITKSDSIHYEPVRFNTAFGGCMEMYSDGETVANYLNAHEGWFCRCAQPMEVEPMGNNGYILTVGRFGSFGYEVEPKMAVILHPPQDSVYLTESVPVPDYTPAGYDVDYKAKMYLEEISISEAAQGIENIYKKNKQSLPNVITKVNWELKLDVAVQFPKFIHKLPLSLIESTGDRLLSQIIRQISPRLTYKVQLDFHENHNLPIPAKGGRTFFKLESEG